MTAEPSFRTILIVADRPRAIDDVIDYFGDPPRPRETRPAQDPIEDREDRPPLTA